MSTLHRACPWMTSPSPESKPAWATTPQHGLPKRACVFAGSGPLNSRLCSLRSTTDSLCITGEARQCSPDPCVAYLNSLHSYLPRVKLHTRHFTHRRAPSHLLGPVAQLASTSDPRQRVRRKSKRILPPSTLPLRVGAHATPLPIKYFINTPAPPPSGS